MNGEPLPTHCLVGFDEPHITKETVIEFPAKDPLSRR
jgi:hypothetical protein